MPSAHLRVFRGSPDEEGRFDEFDVPVEEGMVVLDALHWIQGHEAPDLAVRWNCKAAKCGSCSAEVDGRPSLTCKTRLSDFDLDEPITVEPMRAFPLIRDLVTDVSWNYEVNKTIEPFTPPADLAQEDWRWQQEDIERVQEYRKCIECFLCQDVCHVLRNHETEKPFMGPALPGPDRGSRDAPDRPGRSTRLPQGQRRDRLLQHHQVLHRGLSGAHPDHGQRDHPAEGARRGCLLRSHPVGVAEAARRGFGQRRGHGAASPSGVATARPGAGVSGTFFPDLEPDTDDDRPTRPTARGFVIRTDGAARGNPGPASLGAALYDLARPDARDDRAVPDASISDFLGIQTNNVAEYTGVVRALDLARDLGAREVHLLLDSKLIVEQLAGRWRVKDAKLLPLWTAARRTLSGFDRWSAAHVPRALNSVADALANEAIDRAQAGGPASVVRRPGS